MTSNRIAEPLFSLSVVIPCFNAATWLPKTVSLVAKSCQKAGLKDVEILVVDDGSTDDSLVVARSIGAEYPVKAIPISHRGRYLARKAGIGKARNEYVLLIDTRIHLDLEAMSFIVDQLAHHPDKQVWNGHVEVLKHGNPIARFGDALTYIGWRRYFKSPRTTSFGLDDFDYYPKGTGIFFVPRATIQEAMAEFERATNDIEHSSDDTLLIRLIAKRKRINLSPQFRSYYFARSTLKQFIEHTFFRGQFFVDGFLRPETRFFWPLVAFLVGTPLAALLVALQPELLPVLLGICILIWLSLPLMILLMRKPAADAASMLALFPVFALCYGLGIWRAVIRKYGRI